MLVLDRSFSSLGLSSYGSHERIEADLNVRDVILAMRDTHLEERGTKPTPISIGGLPAFSKLKHELGQRGFRVRTYTDDLSDLGSGRATVLWDFASFAALPRRLAQLGGDRIVGWSLESDRKSVV